MAPNITPYVANKTILIAGAGVSGLAFAISLRKLWPSLPGDPKPPRIIIYERETHADVMGREGYSLSLRSDGVSDGMTALKEMGIVDQMLQASITGQQGEQGTFHVWNNDWQTLIAVSGRERKDLPVEGLRISRKNMRSVLIDAVDPNDQIVWGVSCVSVERGTDMPLNVHLSDGNIASCDVLVAADGSSSKIRSQLRPQDTLDYAGVTCIAAASVFTDGQIPPPADKDWGLVLNGTGISVFVSPQDETRASWNVSWRTATPEPAKKQPMNEEEANDLIRLVQEKGSYFREPFQEIIQNTDKTSIIKFNAMDKTPFEQGNAVRDFPAIFLGDALHAVSPFAGAGANLALHDVFTLAEQFCAYENLEEAVAEFDKRAIPRAAGILKQSRWSIGVAHSTGWMSWFYQWMFSALNWVFFGGRN
ncbi:FAD/NAD(P)-binding domain-containing protein [Eremomyces bilateralis CBS 781.70]|uniref:FAD/NAD(P)-binding domain-containing protein n=1 Tax=Eremomyces bilateralis CBS 781.70 TaxID=1392243 RepID=A0A6G1G977_9PEZI|nr:FAD/NAD(P)-binding domain-containing protein [Eremomyces bilateralis CBS 781.70]KAF1814542.1 FAD/NAD(P)-binding domain-containing protein [Eremomyces bilateralis CBS 781.70]